MLKVDSIQGKWCRIKDNDFYELEEFENADSEQLKNNNKELWVHLSRIWADIICDGVNPLDLYSGPSLESTKTIIKPKEIDEFFCLRIEEIIDLKNGWVKVRLNSGNVGWISNSYICGNPYTICN